MAVVHDDVVWLDPDHWTDRLNTLIIPGCRAPDELDVVPDLQRCFQPLLVDPVARHVATWVLAKLHAEGALPPTALADLALRECDERLVDPQLEREPLVFSAKRSPPGREALWMPRLLVTEHEAYGRLPANPEAALTAL